MIRNHQKGLSLIEVLVGIVIGLLVILATGSLLIVGNKQQRSTVASSQIGQDTSFLHSIFDQAIRNAGTGFIQGNNWSPLGCTLYAKKSLTPIIPKSQSNPDFLNGLLNKIILAPVLIGEGLSGNHLLITMSGSQHIGGAPQEVLASDAAGNTLTLNTHMGFKSGEIVVISSVIPEEGEPDNDPYCFISQVASGHTDISGTQLGLGGTYHSVSHDISNQKSLDLAEKISSYTSFVSALGRIEDTTLDMSVFGIENGVLKRFNLITQDASEDLVEDVSSLHAKYLISKDDGTLEIKEPSGDYSLEKILTLPRTGRLKLLQKIAAIQITLTLQSNDQKELTPRNLSFTVPIRNALFEKNLANPF